MPQEPTEKRIAALVEKLDANKYSNLVREDAVKELSSFGEKAFPHMIRALGDHCWRVSGVALEYIDKQGPQGIPHLVEALKHFDPGVSSRASNILYRMADNLYNWHSRNPANTPEQKALADLFFSIREKETPPGVFYKAFMAVKEGKFKTFGEQEEFVEKLRREHEDALWRLRNKQSPRP